MFTSIADNLSGYIRRIVADVKFTVVGYLLSAAALLCGVGFLIGAGYIAASHRFGHLYAAVGFGVGFIVLAILIMVVHSVVSYARRRRRVEKQYSAQMTGVLGAAAVSLLPGLLRSKVGFFQILAPVIAVAAYAIYRENRGPGSGGPKE